MMDDPMTQGGVPGGVNEPQQPQTPPAPGTDQGGVPPTGEPPVVNPTPGPTPPPAPTGDGTQGTNQ